jgi:hypothetical protein
MKKLLQVLVILLLLFTISTSAFAASATVSVTGPSVIRAGDTLTVAVMVNGTSIYAVRGEIQYDTAQLTYQSISGVLSGWDVTINSQTGKVKFVAEDQKLAAPINSSKQLCKIIFKVSGSIAAGTVIKVTAAGLEASDGQSDINPANASYSVSVAAPLSTNNNLSSLSVDSGTLDPAFSKSMTQYNLSVPFAVEKLKVTAKAEDSGAKVSISSPDLTAGGTTEVTVTVTAASGAKKTYKINVSRAQDPNYVPGANNALADLKIEQTSLSPSFSADKLEYIVYIPYEIDVLIVTATPQDPKAKVAIEGNSTLQVGQDNRIKVNCTAENGSVKTYVIAVIRAAEFTGLDSLTETTATEITTTSETTTVVSETTIPLESTSATSPGETDQENTSGSSNDLLKNILFYVLGILVLAESGVIIYMIFKRR